MRTGRFRPENKLKSPSEYQSVFSDGKKIADSHFLFLYKKNNMEKSRLGLAISKKHIKTAVHRNRVKRLIREGFRHHRTELDGLDVIVLARRTIARHNSVLLRQSLSNGWEKLKK